MVSVQATTPESEDMCSTILCGIVSYIVILMNAVVLKRAACMVYAQLLLNRDVGTNFKVNRSK